MTTIEPTSSGFGVIRPDIVDELRGFASSRYIGKPLAREIDRAILLLRRAADEIERLRGECEWEYGCRSSVHDEPVVLHEGFDYDDNPEEGHGWDCPSPAIVRRRAAGPWKLVEGDGDA